MERGVDGLLELEAELLLLEEERQVRKEDVEEVERERLGRGEKGLENTAVGSVVVGVRGLVCWCMVVGWRGYVCMVLGFVGAGVRVKMVRWVRRALKWVSWD